MCFTHVQLSLPPSCIVCSLCQLVCLVSLSLFLCCHVLSPHSVFQVFDSSCYFWFALVLLTCTLFSACTFFCFCFLDFSGFVCCLFLPRVVACFLFFISWTLFFSFSSNLPACVSRVWVLFFFFATVSSVYMMDSVICSICRLNFFHTVMKTTLPVTTIWKQRMCLNFASQDLFHSWHFGLSGRKSRGVISYLMDYDDINKTCITYVLKKVLSVYA